MAKAAPSAPPTMEKDKASPFLSEAFRSTTSRVFSDTQKTPLAGTLVKAGAVFGGAVSPAPRQE